MKYLIVPNSFKESISSVEIGSKIYSLLSNQNIESILLPLTDGGDDFKETIEFFMSSPSLSSYKINIYNYHLIRKKLSCYQIIEDCASYFGLMKVEKIKRNPWEQNSASFGLMLKEHVRVNKNSNCLIGVGGTATIDLGLGAACEFGVELFDKNGKKLQPIPKNFSSIKEISIPKKLSNKIDLVFDVSVDLYGKNGMVNIFGPQKGLIENDIERMNDAVKHVLILLFEKGINFFNKKYGAGGGFAVGMSLIFDINILNAKEFLIEFFDLENCIINSDVIISSEGKFDEQSLLGKVSGLLIELAERYQKKLFILSFNKVNKNKLSISDRINFINLSKYYNVNEDSFSNPHKGISAAIDEIIAILYHN